MADFINEIIKDPKTLIMAITLLVSTLVGFISIFMSIRSIRTTERLWKLSNRPFILAIVKAKEFGTNHTSYKLIVKNIGNQPAVQIRIRTNNRKLNKCLIEKNTNDPYIESILAWFTEESTIPLLSNGQSTKAPFGNIVKGDNITQADGTKFTSNWKYGCSFPITITYKDLRGENYSHELNLVIKNLETPTGFS